MIRLALNWKRLLFVGCAVYLILMRTGFLAEKPSVLWVDTEPDVTPMTTEPASERPRSWPKLGAYLAGVSEEELTWVFDTLSKAPTYRDPGFQAAAYAILDRFPDGTESLAIPTWFYGHEPSNLFATFIAKYFSNSIREDTLLAIALYGIVYAPGSAGTTQEIFMDATQNHYVTFGYVSPMVFLGKKRYTEDTDLYALITQLSEGKAYADYLHLTDGPAEVVTFIDNHPPLYVTK